jgi:hypothetical protein
MMKKLSIPIVTDVPPDPGYTAGQVLHRIIASIPDVHFDFYWVNHSGLPRNITIPSNCAIARVFGFDLRGVWMALARFTKAHGHDSALWQRVGMAIRLLMWMGKTMMIGGRLGMDLRRSPSQVVWCVVQGEKTVLCYAVAALISGKRLVLHQWDPLSWWMTHRGHPRKVYRFMRVLLNWLERRAVLNVVPSDSWRDRLRGEGKTAMRLDNFFDDPSSGAPAPVLLSDPKALHAVFVGQFYSNEELKALIAELVRVLAGVNRRLVVHFFGHGKPEHLGAGYRVVAHGSLPRDALVERISKWDLALLPYPTEERFSETSKLSFPSKSRVYLAAGLPILSWALQGSSPDMFFRAHYSSNYHNALAGPDMTNFVRSIAEGTALRRWQRYADAQQILREQFSYSSELLPFRDFLTQNA